MTFNKLCTELRKGSVYVRRLQSDLELRVPERSARYKEPYLNFLKKIIALRTFNVPLRNIQEVFRTEKKILELLHFDSINPSSTWYLDACNGQTASPSRLLLTGYDIGFPIKSGHIQWNLDFRERDRELFAKSEMGEDLRRILDLYLARVAKIREVVMVETLVLERALLWSEQAFA